eukprot:scaffold15753_cov79-Isochrysis_galbana.AAC.1
MISAFYIRAPVGCFLIGDEGPTSLDLGAASKKGCVPPPLGCGNRMNLYFGTGRLFSEEDGGSYFGCLGAASK